MDADSRNDLYDMLVASKVHAVRPGLIKIPLAALREFHDKAGMKPDNLACFNFGLSSAGSGTLHRFTYGPNSSETIPPMLGEVYYCDVTTGDCDPITAKAGGALYKAIERDFYARKSKIYGSMSVNQNGRLYVTVDHSKDIIADYYFDLLPDKSGCQFVSPGSGYDYEAWIWLEDDAVYVSNTVIFVMSL
jgi:hypothetical protein